MQQEPWAKAMIRIHSKPQIKSTDIVQLVFVRILAGPVGGRLRDLHPGHFLEVPGKGEGEETGTTVSVYQKTAVEGGFPGDVVDKGGQNKGVVLKKIAGEEPKGEIAYPFFHYFAWIGVNAHGSCTEE